ncbi:MAG: AI-2E family transporter [Phycisphaerales bacterium]|jgi:AI-2 transport protein TqsA
MIPDQSAERNWLANASLLAIATLAIGVVLVYAQPVLIPFVLAAFISVLVYPLLDFQVIKLHIPRPLASIVALFVGLLLLAALFFFLTKAIQSFVSTAGQYTDNFVILTEKCFAKLNSWGLNLNQADIIQNIQTQIPKYARTTFGTVVNFFSSAFLVLIFVIFMVIGRDPNIIHLDVYTAIENEVRRYLAIKAVISSVTGLLVWAILSAINLQLAGVFGMLAFLLNFIPSIGSIIATVLPLPVAVAQFENPWMIVLAIALPGAVQMTIGNIIEPKLMGTRMNLHPITVLMALSFWGLLWGVVGMFLAVPMTAVLRIILMRFDTLKPVGLLLAGKLPKIEKSTT